jgi:hypothetical protein
VAPGDSSAFQGVRQQSHDTGCDERGQQQVGRRRQERRKEP